MGPSPDPRTLYRSVISFEPRTRGRLAEAINVHESQDGAHRPGDSQKHSGEFAQGSCGPEARPPSPILSSNLIQTSKRGDGCQRPSMVWWAQRPLRMRGTIGNTRGRSPDDPVGPSPNPRTLYRSVISFERRTRGWLAEAINGLVFPEALEDTGDYRKHSGRSPDVPVGPSPDPWTLPRSVISFESPSWGWLNHI